MFGQLLCKFALFILDCALFLVVLGKEIVHDVKFLTKCAFNQSCAIFKEFLKLLASNNLFCLVFRQLLCLCLLEVLFLLALRAHFAEFNPLLNKPGFWCGRGLSAGSV